MGRWEEWMRDHVHDKQAEKLDVDRNPAVIEVHMVADDPMKWIHAYIGVRSIGRVFVFAFEEWEGDPKLDSLVKIYRQMLRSLQLNEEVLEYL
jgi:hypothetical protein